MEATASADVNVAIVLLVPGKVSVVLTSGASIQDAAIGGAPVLSSSARASTGVDPGSNRTLAACPGSNRRLIRPARHKQPLRRTQTSLRKAHSRPPDAAGIRKRVSPLSDDDYASAGANWGHGADQLALRQLTADPAGQPCGASNRQLHCRRDRLDTAHCTEHRDTVHGVHQLPHSAERTE